MSSTITVRRGPLAIVEHNEQGIAKVYTGENLAEILRQRGLAQDAATLAGHYANDSVDTDVPGGSTGDRGAKYWAGKAQADGAAQVELAANEKDAAEIARLGAEAARDQTLSVFDSAIDAQARSVGVMNHERLNALETLFSAAVFGAGAITTARVHEEGWFIEINMPASQAGGTWDYSKMTFTCYDWGFDIVEGRIRKVIRQRVMTPTIIKRKAYPNEGSDEANITGATVTFQIVLPEFVFAKAKKGGTGNTGLDPILSTVTGFYTLSGVQAKGQVLTVTNNSTEAYPKVTAKAMQPPYQRLSGTHTGEVMATGYGGRNGRGIVAALRTLTGVTSGATVSGFASAITKSTWIAQKTYPSLVYAVPLSVAAFTQNEVVYENWKCYPWIGDETAIADTSTGGSLLSTADFTTHPHVCDKNGTYPIIYAVVDPVSGNNTSGVASATEATALASPCQTDRYALYKAHLAGVAAYGAGNFSTVIYFANGDSQLTMEMTNIFTAAVQPAMEDTAFKTNPPKAWHVYKPKPGATTARLVSNGGAAPYRTCIDSLTLHCSTTGAVVTQDATSTQATNGGQVWLKNVTLTDAAPATSLHINRCGQVYITGLTDASTTANRPYLSNFGNVWQNVLLLRDADISKPGSNIWAHAINGGYVADMGAASLGGASAATTNALYNSGSLICNFGAFKATGTAVGMGGAGVVEDKTRAYINVFTEIIGTGTQPAWGMSSDGQNNDVLAGVYIENCGYVGARGNWGYEDSFTMAGSGQRKKLYNIRNSYLWEFNHKDDTFQGVSARTHTWNVGHHVGFYNNTYLKPSSGGATPGLPGRTSWLGETFGPREAIITGYLTTTSWQAGIFTNYQAGQVGSGAGNYQPVNNSTLNTVPIDAWTVPFDLLGNARYNDGTGRVGPIERAA